MAFSFPQQQQQRQQQQPSLFQPQFQQQQQPSSFQQQPSSFFQPQQQQKQQQQQQQLQQFRQQQRQQFRQQQQQTQLYLFTKEKTPATCGTKWPDLHPDSQKFLFQIEERILECRDESQRLVQCNRLYDSSIVNEEFEFDAGVVVQELGAISTGMEQQKAVLRELMVLVKDMLRNTEVAVRSFIMICPKFLRTSGGSVSNVTSSPQAPGASGQLVVVPVSDFYGGFPRKPSPFLPQTIATFEKHIGESCQWIEELEQLLHLDSDRNSFNSSSSFLHSLPKVMSNVHDFFVHVAAKVESIHRYMESMKTAYLASQRCRGDRNDPFLEADRRETAEREAAARSRVHPTLHLPPNSQRSTQVASSATPGTSAAAQTPTAVSSAPSGSGFSLYNTPSASTLSSSLSSTPITRTPVSPFTSTFPLFGSTPSPGVSSFITPIVTVPAGGSGASSGTQNRARAKNHTCRH